MLRLLGLIAGLVFHRACGELVLSDNCLGCICEAATGCDRNINCKNGLCGPFGISFLYWEDGGSPKANLAASNFYEDCANNLPCAAETVQNYMSKYSKDCNNDGKINCGDFARIHFLGAGCQGNVSREFITTFETCIKKMEKHC